MPGETLISCHLDKGKTMMKGAGKGKGEGKGAPNKRLSDESSLLLPRLWDLLLHPPRGSAQAQETGAGGEEDVLELSQATTMWLAGYESVSDERAVAREALKRPMHVDPPKDPPASPAVKRRKAKRWSKMQLNDPQLKKLNDAERLAFLNEAPESALLAYDEALDAALLAVDEALKSALLACDEPTSPTSASESAQNSP